MKRNGRIRVLAVLGVSAAVMAFGCSEMPGQDAVAGTEAAVLTESESGNSAEPAETVNGQALEESESGTQSTRDEQSASEIRRFGNYTYVLQEDGSVKITGYEGTDPDLSIPADFDGYAVASVSENAFLNARDIRTVTLPDSLISLEGNPFRYCLNLTQISVSSSHPVFAVIDNVLFEMADKKLVAYPAGKSADSYSVPDGIGKIGETSFVGCSALSQISLPESVVEIGDYAFLGCSSLEDIMIPGKTAVIGANPFAGCRILKSIRVSPENEVFASLEGVLFDKGKLMLVAYPAAHEPQSGRNGETQAETAAEEPDYEVPKAIEQIGPGAFYGCSDLTAVALPASIQYIGGYAFSGCRSLTAVSIPEKVSEIGPFAFYGCSSLSEISLPAAVNEINDGLFAGCGSLHEIVLSHGLTSIGEQAFYGCETMEGIVLPDSLERIGKDAFGSCASITVANIPEKIRKIEDGVFCGCSSLSEISFPEGLESIGNRAFYGCVSIGSAVIPASVESIGEEAFAECSASASFVIDRGSMARDYFVDSGIQYSYSDAMDWLIEARREMEETEPENLHESVNSDFGESETMVPEAETEVDDLAWLKS